MTEPASPGRGTDEPPPIGGRWPRLYWVVIAALATQIALYAALTAFYR